MKILIKFPTRSRPDKFLLVLELMISTAKEPENINVLVSSDYDDPTMTDEVFERARQITKNIAFVKGHSPNKIHAINRDMNIAGEWDICVLASDDMIPQVGYWDKLVRDGFNEHFPDTDGMLWFHDGHQHRICTLTIMGRKYYERFNYLYHPSYVSLWCDNEQTEVGQALGKIRHYPDTILFRHEHPAWDRTKEMDALYVRNEAYFERDRLNFEQRKLNNFDL